VRLLFGFFLFLQFGSLVFLFFHFSNRLLKSRRCGRVARFFPLFFACFSDCLLICLFIIYLLSLALFGGGRSGGDMVCYDDKRV